MSFIAGAGQLVSAALAVVVVSSTVAAGAAAGWTPTAGANPAISSVAPDPSVTRGADGAFHVYASSDDWGDGAGHRLIPHFRSFDMVEWEYVGDAFTSRPSWAPAGSFLWAPDVHVTSGGAVMYYTTGGSEPCIGRATAPGIEGPWSHDSEEVVCFGEYRGQDLDPMDPEVVFTDDGPVMLMGNFEGIHAVPMNAEGTKLDGDPVLIAGTGVEAPAVVTRAGRTHLFTSAGLCCNGEDSQYRVLGGRADSLMGPYVTRTGKSLLGDPANESTSALDGDLILAGNDDWVGPGHVDVATDDAGQDWMLYHAAPRGNAVLNSGIQRRYMMLDRLNWAEVPGTEGTWPVVGNGTPSVERPADPVVALPVRLTAEGEVTQRPVAAAADDALDLSVRIDSTGATYGGHLTVTLTGPGKQRRQLPIETVAAEGKQAAQTAQSLPVTVEAGNPVVQALTLRPGTRLAPGRYELVVAIGQSASAAAVQELAVFGLEVAADGELSFGSGALGSLPFGS